MVWSLTVPEDPPPDRADSAGRWTTLLAARVVCSPKDSLPYTLKRSTGRYSTCVCRMVSRCERVNKFKAALMSTFGMAGAGRASCGDLARKAPLLPISSRDAAKGPAKEREKIQTRRRTWTWRPSADAIEALSSSTCASFLLTEPVRVCPRPLQRLRRSLMHTASRLVRRNRRGAAWL